MWVGVLVGEGLKVARCCWARVGGSGGLGAVLLLVGPVLRLWPGRCMLGFWFVSGGRSFSDGSGGCRRSSSPPALRGCTVAVSLAFRTNGADASPSRWWFSPKQNAALPLSNALYNESDGSTATNAPDRISGMPQCMPAWLTKPILELVGLDFLPRQHCRYRRRVRAGNSRGTGIRGLGTRKREGCRRCSEWLRVNTRSTHGC